MKICCISDTHTKHEDLSIPECDLLISAGDYSNTGELSSVYKFHMWLSQQPAKHKISLQGNHEVYVEHNYRQVKSMIEAMDLGIKFCAYSTILIPELNLKLYCNSATPWFNNWAYNYKGEDIKKHWDEIPEDVDILVTHGPAFGILDVIRPEAQVKHHLGCHYLAKRLPELSKLKLHVFGHIHGSSGILVDAKGITYCNASICDEEYNPVNPVRIIEL